jgi:hypothetical protein
MGDGPDVVGADGPYLQGMDITNDAEEVADTIGRLARQLWDMITVDRQHIDRNAAIHDLEQRLAAATSHHDGVTPHDVESICSRMIDQLPHSQSVDIDTLRTALSSLRPAAAAAPAPAPAPRVIRQIVEKPVIQRVTEQRVVRVTEQVHHDVTNVTNVTNNNTKVVNEGDTKIDNRTTTTINATGDVHFDQKVDNTNVVTGSHGVAVNGSASDVAVNTGKNTGVVAGGDVHLEDSVVGNHNTQVNDSTAGAVSGHGEATNVTGDQVNTGSGDLVHAEADGSAQVATGNNNKLTGAADVSFDKAHGPSNVAVGENVSQNGAQDNSAHVDTSTRVHEDTKVVATDTHHVVDNSHDSVDVAQTGDGNHAEISESGSGHSELVKGMGAHLPEAGHEPPVGHGDVPPAQQPGLDNDVHSTETVLDHQPGLDNDVHSTETVLDHQPGLDNDIHSAETALDSGQQPLHAELFDANDHNVVDDQLAVDHGLTHDGIDQVDD